MEESVYQDKNNDNALSDTQREKTVRGASWLFAILVSVSLIVSLILKFAGAGAHLHIIVNILLSQGLILIPTVAYILITRCSIKDTVRINKTHWGFIFIVPLFVLALEPVTSVINAVSLMWVDNATTNLVNGLVGKYPLWVSTLLMAVTPCIVEELSYRGVILGSYRHCGRIRAVVVSGVLFGLMHMNFNQMAYAVFLGIMLGFLVEATGSILPTMFAHFCFNEMSVLISYVTTHSAPLRKIMQQSSAVTASRQQLMATIIAMLPLAVGGLIVAIALLYAMVCLNNRRQYFSNMFHGGEDRENSKRVNILSLPLVVTVVVCVVIMILIEVL